MRSGISRVLWGIAHASRSRWGVLAGVAIGVVALDLLLPPALLSVVRKPFDYFAFNAWLPELPHYLLNSEVPLQRKLEFIPNLALFWFSADSPFGGVDWGFAVTVADMLRFLLLGLLFGIYFALVLYCKDQQTVVRNSKVSGGGGVSGALASVLGISTGGCTVMGCGAPIIPVVGLAFVGLSSGTLVLLAEVSRVATGLIFFAVTLGVVYFAWIAGSADAVGPSIRPSSGGPARSIVHHPPPR